MLSAIKTYLIIRDSYLTIALQYFYNRMILKLTFSTLTFILLYTRVSAQITFQERLGTIHSDGASRVEALSDSGFIIFGNHGGGSHDTIIILRTNKWGNEIWAKKYWMDSTFTNVSFKQLADGNFLIAGTYFTTNQNSHLALFQIDESGEVLSNSSYLFPHSAASRPVSQTKDGGFIIPFLYDTTLSQHSSTSYGLLKTDSTGIISWCKSYEMDSINREVMSIKQIEDSGYLFLAINMNYNGTVFIDYSIKLDVNGNILHANTFEELSMNFNSHLQQINGNSFFLAGGNQMYCFDSTANLIWEKKFADQIIVESSIVMSDNKIALAGYSYDSSGTDAIFIEVDSTGNLFNNKKYGSTFLDYSLGFCEANDGGFCHVGWTKSFGADSIDIYVIKTDLNGNSGCNEIPFTPIIDTVTNNIFSPFTMNVTNLNPVRVSDTLYSDTISLSQTVICSIATSTIAVKNVTSQITISPNPTSNTFKIKLNSEINFGEVEILSALGEPVYSAAIRKENVINQKLAPGIYFVKVSNGEKQCVEKLIVQ